MATKPLSAPTAFLSDVHGNLPALDAVLAELARRAVDGIYVAGDLLLGGDQPLEVWRRLERAGAHCVAGPSEVALARVTPDALKPASPEEAARLTRFRDTRAALGDIVLRKLGALPYTLRLPLVDGRELLLVHGSPADPFEGITHDMPDEEVAELLGSEHADIVVCGSTHVPFRRALEGVEIVNVGSVGAAPEGAFAHFSVLFPKVNGADIEQTWVEYAPQP